MRLIHTELCNRMSNSEQPRLTRQQIYDRIRQTSKDEFILEDMIRLGFWPAEQDVPSLPAQLIRKEGELSRELRNLLKKQKRYQDREKMLRDMRKKRLEESRRKRAETKARKKREREARARRWQEQKTREIVYLGDGVSGGLQDKTSSAERLERYHLPFFDGIESLAEAMNVSVGELRFLSFHRKVSKTTHYHRFYIQKKLGGLRLISAPMPRLKAVQLWILEHILMQIPLHPSAHGFRPAHSIVTNAEPHVGQDIVVNMDIKDFFPSITYKRTKGLFCSLGYSEQLSTIFALVCTEPDVDDIELDGETYYAAKSERHLPQGAPSSPAITNVICSRLDSRLHGMANALHLSYSRYADDMTFSGAHVTEKQLATLLWQTEQIVNDEGFALHPGKLRVMRKGSRQEVTGIVVNERVSLPRKTLRKFRALLFQVEKDGFQGKHWNGHDVSLTTLMGFARYVTMVNPEKGRPLLERVERLVARECS